MILYSVLHCDLIDLLYNVFYMQESFMDHHGMEVDQQPTDSNLP